MFRKSDPPAGKDLLADRVRHVKNRKSPADVEQPPPRKAQERGLRQPVYKQGVLILECGQKIIVAIKDLSSTGARVETRERLVLPDEVLLTEATLGLRRRARVVWHREGAAGLQFIGP